MEIVKISDLITPIKYWNTNALTKFLPDHIANKIKAILILSLILMTELSEIFFSNSEYMVKTVTWANNNIMIRPHPKAKLLNSIWQLNLIPNVNLCLKINSTSSSN